MADEGFQYGFIKLEEIPAVYYPGQILNGAVVFDIHHTLNYCVIYVQYVGEANVLWTFTQIDKVDGMKRRSEVRYEGHEEYFNFTDTLIGGHGVSQLPPKHHSLPFKYQIPFTAPSSFKGQKGSVSYTIIATIVYPNMQKEVLKKTFEVVAPLDLNTGNPALREPIDIELEEVSACNWCCTSGPVTVRVRLPVTGYCPGQTIPLSIELRNESSVEITKMVFQIITKELYRSTQPPSEHVAPTKVLATVNRGTVLSNTKQNITCDLVVPDMIVPYLERCNIIDVGYFFKATISMSGCNDDLVGESEMCLGLVPLAETLTAPYVHPMAESLPSGPIPDQPSGLTVPQAPTPAYHGSHNSINRSQQNLNQGGFQQDYPPPYPGNGSYPTDNTSRTSPVEIGFRTPDRRSASDMPYPMTEKPPTIPPYPTANVMPGRTSPYPANVPGTSPYPAANVPGTSPYPYPAGTSSYPGNRGQGNNSDMPPSYAQTGFAPSAPPQ